MLYRSSTKITISFSNFNDFFVCGFIFWYSIISIVLLLWRPTTQKVCFESVYLLIFGVFTRRTWFLIIHSRFEQIYIFFKTINYLILAGNLLSLNVCFGRKGLLCENITQNIFNWNFSAFPFNFTFIETEVVYFSIPVHLFYRFVFQSLI